MMVFPLVKTFLVLEAEYSKWRVVVCSFLTDKIIVKEILTQVRQVIFTVN